VKEGLIANPAFHSCGELVLSHTRGTKEAPERRPVNEIAEVERLDYSYMRRAA
jgi:hypothetical protein